MNDSELTKQLCRNILKTTQLRFVVMLVYTGMVGFFGVYCLSLHFTVLGLCLVFAALALSPLFYDMYKDYVYYTKQLVYLEAAHGKE